MAYYECTNQKEVKGRLQLIGNNTNASARRLYLYLNNILCFKYDGWSYANQYEWEFKCNL